LRRDAKVTGLPIQLGHLLLRHRVGARNGGDEQLLAEADLDRFERRRQAALDEVCDRSEVVDRTGSKDFGHQTNQLVPAARSLHLVQVRGQV